MKSETNFCPRCGKPVWCSPADAIHTCSPPDKTRDSSHWEGCWNTRGHHECAIGRVDRLERELAECKRHNVRVLYKSLPESDPITEMLLKSILQAMDEWHSLTSKVKGLAGMAENVRQGWRAGGRAPRGYRLQHEETGAIRDGAPVTKLGAQDAGSHFSSAASAARRTTRPGNIFPPPRTHFFSSTLAPSISPALIFRRKVEPASRVAPRL